MGKTEGKSQATATVEFKVVDKDGNVKQVVKRVEKVNVKED